MRRHLKTYVLVVAVLIVAAALGFFSADAQQNGLAYVAVGSWLCKNALLHGILAAVILALLRGIG